MAGKYVTIAQVFAGVLPFIIMDLFVIALVIAAPSVVMFLPDLLK